VKKLLDKHPGLECRYLMVGQGELFMKPMLAQTILGSCVSVTFHCRALGLGGVFHALLPHWAEYERGAPIIEPYKYVDTAITRMCEKLDNLGVRLSDVECKVFGGAGTIFNNGVSMGAKNVMAAYEILAERRLRITASHVGGERGRKLVFVAHTGEVYVKFLKRPVNAAGEVQGR